MAKRKTKKQVKRAKAPKEKKEAPKVKPREFVGKTRNFRFKNPEGHLDKWRWVTLNEGDVIPPEVLSILEKEERHEEAKRRVKALEEDLADDNKRNFSTDGNKNSPGRKKKSKKNSKK